MAISANITEPLKELVTEIISHTPFNNNNESNANVSTILSMLELDYETPNIRMLLFTMICAIIIYFTFTKTLSFCRDLMRTAIKICLYSVAAIPFITSVIILYFWASGNAPDRISDIVKVATVLNITVADIINKIPFI